MRSRDSPARTCASIDKQFSTIFRLVDGKPANEFSLTNLYASAQIAPMDRFAFELSYSGQRNAICYRTFGSSLDSHLLSDNQLRHEVRASVNLRPSNSTFVLLGSGYSFQEGDINPTRDANVTLTQSDIPLLRLTCTLSYSRIVSNYLDGAVYGISVMKYLPFNSTTVSAGCSMIN